MCKGVKICYHTINEIRLDALFCALKFIKICHYNAVSFYHILYSNALKHLQFSKL